MLYELENSFEIEKKVKECKVAVMPVGAIEAHGPHLPLGTDNIIAERLAGIAAEKTGAMLLPLLPYGQVWSLGNFPGSIHIQSQHLSAMICDIGGSLYSQGFSIFVIINGHLGNADALNEAARELYEKHPDFKVLYLSYPGIGEVLSHIRESRQLHSRYFHACEVETSIMLYLAGEYVNMEKAIKDIPDIPAEIDCSPVKWSSFTSTAVLGDATLATTEKGMKIVEKVMEYMVSFIENAKGKNGSTG
jgi:creatinine amidohydrolase